MNKYIGNNIEVNAEPMTLGKAIEKGFVACASNEQLSKDQASRAGYIVEYANGFYQWLDKEIFDSHYAKADSDIDKLYVERKQVADRFQTICLLTAKPNFNELVPSIEERKLILHQQTHMNEYLNVLNQRIKLFFTYNK